MGKALIIGAGGVSSVVVHKCCQNPDVFEEICIASRNIEKCEALKSKLAGSRTKIHTAQINADNSDMLIELIMRFRPDIIIPFCYCFPAIIIKLYRGISSITIPLKHFFV